MGLTDPSLHTLEKQRDPRFAERLLSEPEWAHDYAWPGNVRELENFIRARGHPVARVRSSASPGRVKQEPQEHHSKLSTLDEAEREHILRALRASNWVMAGPDGAAAKLGMKRTTLAYRVRKLKISCRPQ